MGIPGGLGGPKRRHTPIRSSSTAIGSVVFSCLIGQNLVGWVREGDAPTTHLLGRGLSASGRCKSDLGGCLADNQCFGGSADFAILTIQSSTVDRSLGTRRLQLRHEFLFDLQMVEPASDQDPPLALVTG